MSFYMTLPSNASTNHAVNTQSNYTTHLNSPLNFSVPYEVALVEFAYREFVLFEIGSIKVTFGKETKPRIFQMTAHDNEPIDHLINRLNYEILDYFIKLECLVKVNKIDPLENQNLYVKENWEKLENRDKIYIENYQYFKQRCPYFESRSSFKNLVTLVIPDKDCKSVEFTAHSLKLFQTNNRIITENHEFTIMSELLNFMDYIMIYTDLIEPQAVGDTYAPLLRVISKTGEFNHTTEKIYTNPHYLHVNKSFITSINIDIRDPSGEQIKFGNQLSKVILKLHFRPINE